MKLCDYRCGKEAKYQFKNGKWCCNKSWNSCPKRREEHSKIMKDIMNHTEVKTKCSKAAKESWKDLEKRKNRIESIKKSWKDPEIKERLIRAIRKACNQPEIKEKNSKTTKESWKNPEVKEKMTKAIKESHNRPEVKEKCSKAAKESWKDLEKRKNRTESINRPKVRRKKRLARIKDMKKKHGQLIPNYNLEGCKIIDEYSKKHKYNFQHAENGGEFYIKELGYWVDGYDKERNVVIEIDEPAHYNINGNLSKQDIERQKEIENHLNCKFIRIKI